MLSHGNIIHATLGVMLHGMEMAKIEEVCIHPMLLSCHPNPSPATCVGHP